MIKFKVKVMLAMREMTQKELAERTGIRPPTISAVHTLNTSNSRNYCGGYAFGAPPLPLESGTIDLAASVREKSNAQR